MRARRAKVATMLQPSPGLGGSKTEAVANCIRGTDELTLVLWCYWLLQRPKYSGPAFPPTSLRERLTCLGEDGRWGFFCDQRSGLLRLTRRRLRRRSRAEPAESGPSVPGHVTRAKSRLHYVLFITALIVWNRTRASTSWTLTFIVGVFVNNAFSFTFWTGFHSQPSIFLALVPA